MIERTSIVVLWNRTYPKSGGFARIGRWTVRDRQVAGLASDRTLMLCQTDAWWRQRLRDPTRNPMTQRLVTYLLVEDDDTHAYLVKRSLDKARVANEVYRVADGAEAMAFLRQEGEYADKPRPDVVLLDLQLPKMNGHEVLTAIKQDPDLKKIPVVIMTTSDAETDRERAYEHRANSYIVKPVDFDKFCRLVDDLCHYWGVWNESPFAD
jgi:CheY-like chemotaxis protein